MTEQSRYDEYLQLLDFRDVSPLEAERIAEKCFMAQAWVVRDLAAAEYKDILQKDALDVLEAEIMLTVPAECKNTETRAAWVVTRPTRKAEFEKHAVTKVKVEHLKRLLKLFEKASDYYGRKSQR